MTALVMKEGRKERQGEKRKALTITMETTR
jgi:hypothetical protein